MKHAQCGIEEEYGLHHADAQTCQCHVPLPWKQAQCGLQATAELLDAGVVNVSRAAQAAVAAANSELGAALAGANVTLARSQQQHPEVTLLDLAHLPVNTCTALQSSCIAIRSQACLPVCLPQVAKRAEEIAMELGRVAKEAEIANEEADSSLPQQDLALFGASLLQPIANLTGLASNANQSTAVSALNVRQ